MAQEDSSQNKNNKRQAKSTQTSTLQTKKRSNLKENVAFFYVGVGAAVLLSAIVFLAPLAFLMLKALIGFIIIVIVGAALLYMGITLAHDKKKGQEASPDDPF